MVSNTCFYWIVSSGTSPLDFQETTLIWLSSYISDNFPQSLVLFPLSSTILWTFLMSKCLLSVEVFCFTSWVQFILICKSLLKTSVDWMSPQNPDSYFPMPTNISLGYPMDNLILAYLKLSPNLCCLHCDCMPSQGHCSACSAYFKESTSHSAIQARKYKVRFDFTFSIHFLTNYTPSQSKNWTLLFQKKSFSFYWYYIPPNKQNNNFLEIPIFVLYYITAEKSSIHADYKHSVFRIFWLFIFTFKTKSKV